MSNYEINLFGGGFIRANKMWLVGTVNRNCVVGVEATLFVDQTGTALQAHPNPKETHTTIFYFAADKVKEVKKNKTVIYRRRIWNLSTEQAQKHMDKLSEVLTGDVVKKKKKLDPYGERLDQIWNRVSEALGGEKETVVQYSAYPMDDKELPVDNLDDIAVKGKVQFIEKHNGWGQGTDYESPVVENPTWLELCKLTNEMIKVTGDHHHCFLEGVRGKEVVDGVRIAKFIMGS